MTLSPDQSSLLLWLSTVELGTAEDAAEHLARQLPDLTPPPLWQDRAESALVALRTFGLVAESPAGYRLTFRGTNVAEAVVRHYETKAAADERKRGPEPRSLH